MRRVSCIAAATVLAAIALGGCGSSDKSRSAVLADAGTGGSGGTGTGGANTGGKGATSATGGAAGTGTVTDAGVDADATDSSIPDDASRGPTDSGISEADARPGVCVDGSTPDCSIFDLSGPNPFDGSKLTVKLSPGTPGLQFATVTTTIANCTIGEQPDSQDFIFDADVRGRTVSADLSSYITQANYTASWVTDVILTTAVCGQMFTVRVNNGGTVVQGTGQCDSSFNAPICSLVGTFP